MKRSLVLFLCLLAGALLASELDFTHAKILLPPKASKNVKNAASLLQSAMDKFAKKGKSNKVIRLQVVPPGKEGKRSWQLLQKGNTLTITGRSESSLVFAVGDLLARSGFYVLSWDCDALPESGRLMVKKGLNVNSRMAFGKIRLVDGLRVSGASPLNKEFRRYMYLNYAYQNARDDDSIYASYRGINEVHNIYKYVPPARYAKSHPEYYTLNQAGKRSWTTTDHLCFSNPEVRKVIAENMIKTIASHRKGRPPYPVYYPFSQNDCGRSFCFCSNCQSLIKKYEGATGLLLETVNTVAKEVGKVYPDVKIATEAYVNSAIPSKKIKPASNVVIRYCDLYSKSDCRIPLEEQKDRLDLLARWAKDCKGMAIWDYLNFSKSNSPETVLNALQKDLLLFKKLAVGNVLLEASCRFGRMQSFAILQMFISRQLLKDPAQDQEKLIHIFMKAYYGKCAKELKEYYTILHERLAKRLPTDNMQFLLKSRDLLMKALQKAGKDVTLKTRILNELNNVNHALVRQYKIQAIPRQEFLKKIKEHETNLLFALENNALLVKSQKDNLRKEIENEIDMLSIDFPLPEKLDKKNVKATLKLGLSYFRGVTNSGAILTADPDSEMKLVLAMQDPKVKHKKHFPLGMYDWQQKKVFPFNIAKPIADGRYHWYKMGNITLGPNSVIYLHGSWGMMVTLRSLYINDDGMTAADNPNTYELWVSLKFRGPAYTGKNSTKGAVFLDKVLLVSLK